jgi:hypothetical protein
VVLLKLLPLFILLGLSSAFANVDPMTMPVVTAAEVVQIDHTPAGSVQIQSGKVDTDLEHFDQVLEQIPADKELLLSTDSEDIAGAVLQRESQDEQRTGQTRVLPLGPLQEKIKNNAVFKNLNRFKNHLIQAAKNDKIGVIIVVFNTAYDSFIWIHATQYSPEARAAQVIFGTLNALVFSLDKDAWAHSARTIKNRVFKILDLTQESRTADVVGRFAANLTLAVGVQSLRLALLSMDRVWNLPDLLSTAGDTFLLSLGLTFGGFGWTELARDINSSTHPASKFLVRRVAEMRSLLMGHVSPSSKLLQTNVYGYTPWVALAVHGAVGLALFLNNRYLTNLSESKLGVAFAWQKIQLENLWNTLAQRVGIDLPSTRQCRRLFVGL